MIICINIVKLGSFSRENSVEKWERSILALGSLCLPCNVRDTARSWFYKHYDIQNISKILNFLVWYMFYWKQIININKKSYKSEKVRTSLSGCKKLYLYLQSIFFSTTVKYFYILKPASFVLSDIKQNQCHYSTVEIIITIITKTTI